MQMRELLEGGTRRSLGRSGEAVRRVLDHPDEFGALIEHIWDLDPVVRMRAADAVEKVSVERPDLLQPFRRELMGLLAEETQQEVRWHLALMVPRLDLSAAERRRACEGLRAWLEDRGSLVRTLAMQGLADLAQRDETLKPAIAEEIRRLTRSGTAAMKARGRKLLAALL